MIPKVIHYCWFGGHELPESANRCIQSWKKFLPDYEIKEWNESNFNVHCCAYVEQAYEKGKWAFVSDFARFWILFHEGGVYFDTDVELIKSLQPILDKGPFFGVEKGETLMVAPGLGMAAYPDMPFYRDVINDYKGDHFTNEAGEMNLTTVVERTTSLLKQRGLDSLELNHGTKVDDIFIYPPDYFCPLDFQTGILTITPITYSIHHYDGSWITEEQRRKQMLKYQYYRALSKCLPDNVAYYISDNLGRTKAFYEQGGIALVIKKAIKRFCK